MDVDNRIKELVDILNKYSKAYYIDNSPLVSDVEYDRLYKELEDLEKKYPEYVMEDSPTKTVGIKHNNIISFK